jgi:hypothetical protein
MAAAASRPSRWYCRATEEYSRLRSVEAMELAGGMTVFTHFRTASRNLLVMFVSCFAAAGILPATAKATFTKVKFPHANPTQAELINNHGVVAGQYGDGFAGRAFLRSADGSFTGFAVDGAVVTIPRGLTDAGAIGGRYDLPNDSIHGFFRDAAGNLTPFDGPGLGAAEIDGMNASNDIVGTYAVDNNGLLGGFIRHADGTITTFNIHGVTASGGFSIAGIDDGGQVAGDYSDPGFVSHAFLRSSSGEITKFQAPDARAKSFGDGTDVVAISSNGWVTGFYTGKGGTHHYSRSPDGQFEEFDLPGGQSNQTTAVNDEGVIVGSYSTSFHLHGFLRKPGGKFVTFDLPWGETESMGVLSVNDSSQIAGYAFYGTFGKREFGFIRTP